MEIAIIIPTFNEKENITRMISEIFAHGIKGLKIVVVDDNSPDQTGRIVEEMKKEDSRIHVIHRLGKLGLGTAYLEGFRYALDKGAEYIFEIDADFSHDPKIIPNFLEAIKKADLVIGSRYIRGGAMRVDFIRRLISRLGSFYARIVLGIPIHDLTGGYKCFRRKVLESIDFNNIHASNYAFQIEMTYKTYKKNFQVKEIPIVFTIRQEGKSKFYFKMIFESFWLVLKLRFQK